MVPDSRTTARNVKTTFRGLTTRLKTTQAMLAEARAKLAKMEIGVTSLQDFKRKRSDVVDAERDRLQQRSSELQGLAREAHQVANDVAAKKVPELRRLPRTPSGKQTYQYGAHDNGNANGFLQHLDGDKRPDSASSGGTFFDARQGRVDSPMREQRKSWDSDDGGFVSARQSLEDPFID